MKSMFSQFSKDYFREVLYILSSKVDGKIIYDSTLLDIEFFIEKIKQEQQETSNNSLDF